MRERGITTPALFLTAHDLLDDKVAGFEAGADDYLAKPFSPRELEYRIEALLRRGQLAPETAGDGERLEIGDLVVDKRRHEVSRAGQRVDLTPLEFQILATAQSLRPRCHATISSIASGALSTKGTNATSIPTHQSLRKKLETIPKPSFILTVAAWATS